MRQVKVHLESVPGSPYSQSRQHDAPMLDRENHGAYDQRTWLEHLTTNKDGQVCVPAMAFKQCIDTAAYKLGEKVQGRRGATYKNFFASGFLCDGDMPLANGKAVTKDHGVDSVTISANLDGIRGSGKRGLRRFPVIPKWHGVASFTILDDLITPEVFETHVRAAGMIVGIGRFRPEKGGINGRFKPVKFTWKNVEF
jgi:hypothetical protein